MLLAEHLGEEIRAAVDHLRLLAVVGHGVHHAEELHDPPNPWRSKADAPSSLIGAPPGERRHVTRSWA
jgi:hypothetical protein